MDADQDKRPIADVATVLQRLLDAGEAIVGLRDPGPVRGDDQAWLAGLVADTRAWHERAADRDRVVHYYTCLFAEALQIAAAARRLHRVSQEQIYFQIIGLILPLIRADFGEAIHQRNRPSP